MLKLVSYLFLFAGVIGYSSMLLAQMKDDSLMTPCPSPSVLEYQVNDADQSNRQLFRHNNKIYHFEMEPTAFVNQKFRPGKKGCVPMFEKESWLCSCCYLSYQNNYLCIYQNINSDKMKK